MLSKGKIMDYIQSFKRFETKYLLTEAQAQAFVQETGKMLVPDAYGSYSICNVYLDTEDFYFIEHSLDKPVYKEKLRIRSYGMAAPEDRVFLEIKKKSRGIVYKRRITLPLWEAEEYLKKGTRPLSIQGFQAGQIFAEIDYLVQHYMPTPKVYLAYDREACFVEGYPQLRITFDRNVRSRWEKLTLASDEETLPLKTGVDNYRLMEIKSDGVLPLELTAVLSRLKLYPVSFSKYGNVYLEKRSREAVKEK